MSAIGAIFSGEGVSQLALDGMVDSLSAITHDETGGWRGGPFALAACTFHTTAESREASQPAMSDDGQTVAVFDGFLLNHAELAETLEAKGCRPRNLSDVEIALCAYRAWGDKCAVHLEGEFAMIVANLKAGRLFAARDHIGLVPLYYRQDGERLLVASDYRTLAHLGTRSLEPDRGYLAQIMSNRWYMREATPWREIKRIIRAHSLTFDGNRIVTDNYWLPPTEVTIRYSRDEDYAEHYRELLFDCVKRASRSDRTIATAVSGGLDSTALFGIADRLDKNGDLQAPGLRAYSFSASEGSNAFELPYARAAARRAGRELIECPLFDPEIEYYTKEATRHLDIPMPSNGAMMLGIDRQVVADGSRVIINGNGGDEWLQGNEMYYREFAQNREWTAFAKALGRDARALGWPGALKTAGRHAAAELMPPQIRQAIRTRLRERRRTGEEELFWLKPDLRDILSEAESDYDRLLPDDVMAWIKHNLARTPRGDLANSLMRRQRADLGIESRHPMLSRRFMEFSLRTHAHIKRRAGISKFIHREAMTDLLPPEVFERQTKANFTNTKIDSQFANYVRNFGTERLADLCESDGLDKILAIDFHSPEGDWWAWEIWGLYAAAVFLYNCDQMRSA